MPRKWAEATQETKEGIYTVMRNVYGSKFSPKTVKVYLLMSITSPLPLSTPDRTLFLFFFFEENIDTKNQSVILICDFNALILVGRMVAQYITLTFIQN